MTAAIRLLVLMVLFTPLPLIAEEKLTAKELEARFLACHDAIRTWTIELRVDQEQQFQGRTQKISFGHTYWNDGQSRRMDWWQPYVGQGAPNGVRLVEYNVNRRHEERWLLNPDRLVIYQSNELIRMDAQDFGASAMIASSILPPKWINEHHRQKFYDPRVIGLGGDQFGLVHHQSLESVRDFQTGESAVLSETVAEETDASGKPLLVLHYEFINRKTPLTKRFWLDPVRGFHPVQAEMVATRENGNKVYYRSRFELQHDAEAKIWFPRKVSHQRTFNDTQQLKEEWTISRAEFNREIPAKVFTLQGLEIAKDRVFQDSSVEPGKPHLFVWDGEKLVPYTPKPAK